MIATLIELCNYLPYLYIAMFVGCIGITKKLTSLSITIILMACTEVLLDAAEIPLFSLVSDKSLEYEVRVGIWLMFWTTCYFVAVFILQKFHDWLNLVKGRAVYRVQALLTAAIAVELITFTNTIFIKTTFIKQMYTAAIPILGLLIGVYLFIELGLSIREKYADHNIITGRSA